VNATACRSVAQTLTLIFGGWFLLLGLVGFLPGITQNVGSITLAGTQSDAELLGIFELSVLHNAIHLAFASGLVLARTAASARAFLVGGAVFYAALFAFGLLVSDRDGANFIPMNSASDLSHLGFAAAFAGAYALARRDAPPRTTREAVG
jgi:hypothetical protein